MSWREDLTTAEFRGFTFLTDSHETKYGKRLVVHQYPKSNDVDVENFGDDAIDPRLNAYFIGENYHLEANGFLEKLKVPGADWLNHPWLGQLWVEAHNWSRTESNDKGGYCQITINFVKGGRAPYEPTIDKVDVAYSRVRELSTAIIDDFELKPMSNDVLTEFTADISQQLEGIREAISLVTLPLTWATQAFNVIQGVKTDINALLAIPSQYATALGSFANILSFGGISDESITTRTRARSVARLTTTAINPPAINASTAPATISADYKINIAREAALRSQMLIVAASQIAIADYQDAETRDAVLDKLLTAIDSQLPNMGDDVFSAALNARTALIDVLLDQDLNAATVRDIVNALPSVVLSHQMNVNEADFIEKNKVSHPLFVQGRVYG